MSSHAGESDSANLVLWVLNNVDVYSDYAPWPTGICLQSAASPDSPSHYHTKSDFWKVYPSCNNMWTNCWQQWASCFWKNHVISSKQFKLPILRDTLSLPDILTCLQAINSFRVWWKLGIVRDTLLLQTCQNPWFPKPAILTHTNSQSVESPFSLDGSRSVIAAFDRLYNFIYWLVQSADILCWLSKCLLVQFPFSLRQPHFLGSVLLAKIISNPNNAFFLYLFRVCQFTFLYIEHMLAISAGQLTMFEQ